MGFTQALTRTLMHRLPEDEQARMVADVIAWRFADLPRAEQQAKIEQLGPGLMEMMHQGRLGLPLLMYYYLMRTPVLRWLVRRDGGESDVWRAPATNSVSRGGRVEL